MKDPNEKFRAGIDLLALGDGARPYAAGAVVPLKTNGQLVVATAESDTFELVRLADVEPQSISWLWKDRLPRGHLTLFASNPGMGKSQMTIDWAARLTRGTHWPLGARSDEGAAIFLCSEDGIADTIRPRAEAAGADLDKIHILKSTIVKAGKKRGFNLGEDLDVLGKAVASVGDVALVCIDALTSYMGKIDSHRNTDVRMVLEPVAGFAATHGVAMLGVTHVPKSSHGSAMNVFLGSIGFIATCRVALLAVAEADSDRRLLIPVKNSFGALPSGIGYRIKTKEISHGIVAPFVEWSDEPVDVSADQALHAAAEDIKNPGAIKRAKEFLLEFLKNGPVDSGECIKAAEADGIKQRTLERAKARLGAKSVKPEFESGWKWALK